MNIVKAFPRLLWYLYQKCYFHVILSVAKNPYCPFRERILRHFIPQNDF